MTLTLQSHDPSWSDAFLEEAHRLQNTLSGIDIQLHHIGSTAIPNILAKPIIDLLGVVDEFASLDRSGRNLEELGYEVMGAFGIENRRYFRKIDRFGLRTHHLH